MYGNACRKSGLRRGTRFERKSMEYIHTLNAYRHRCMHAVVNNKLIMYDLRRIIGLFTSDGRWKIVFKTMIKIAMYNYTDT